MAPNIKTFLFDKPESHRLDKFLVTCIPEYSRSRIQKLINSGSVRLDGVVIEKNGYKLDSKVVIKITIPPIAPSKLIPEKIPLTIIYEDENILVVDKPAGMVVHPSAGHQSGTLVHAVLGHVPDIEGVGGEHRPGVVHRLDKDTSGVILMAKNDKALHYFGKQFSKRQVKKTYLALVDGKPPTPEGRVEAPIGRDPTHRQRMAVVQRNKGRDAVTEYSTKHTYAAHSLLSLHPITGRTHQIRVHLAFLDTPVVADTTYGRRTPTISLERQFLHAAQLKVKLLDQSEFTSFESPLPKDLKNTLAKLR